MFMLKTHPSVFIVGVGILASIVTLLPNVTAHDDQPDTALKYKPASLQSRDSNDIPLQADAKCELCEYFVEKIVTGLSGPTVKLLWNSCLSITNSSTLCGEIVKQIMQVYQQVVEKDLPLYACQSAKLCPASSPSHKLSHLRDSEFHVLALKIPYVCDICKYIVLFVDNLLDKQLDSSKKYIETNICHHLTPPTDKECSKVIEQLYSEIQKLLKQGGLSPITVCTKDIPVC